MSSLKRWADEMRLLGKKLAADGLRVHEEPLRADRADWSKDEVLVQPLFHNAHMLETGTTEELIHAGCGRVTTMPGDETYDGATRHTNNTAELTALLRAVQDELRVDDGAVVEFCVDSTYAQGVALGRWQTK